MDASEDETSGLEALQSKVEDLEMRVGQVLTKQLQTKQELDMIQESSEIAQDSLLEECKPELKLPDDYHFTEDLKSIMDDMIASQKAWQESVENTKIRKTGLKSSQIFKEMNKHVSDRLEYLEMTKTLLEGPILEEPPPPPPEEEKPAEEPEVEEKGSKKGKAAKKNVKKVKKK